MKTPINFQIDIHYKQMLVQAAQKEDRTLSALIRRILELWLEENFQGSVTTDDDVVEEPVSMLGYNENPLGTSDEHIDEERAFWEQRAKRPMGPPQAAPKISHEDLDAYLEQNPRPPDE